ncbi:MAG TPA: preprotein translocase subunit SecG [Bacteroidota bacterium]|nr:preprotein translocase subunit SecG [Bacteroidota bacterium]
MFWILILIEIIVSILLMIVVLMQSSKGGGLAGTLGGSSMGTMFGVRRTSDFLSSATMYLSALFVVLCLIINIFFLPGKSSSTESIIQKGGAPTSSPQPVPPSSAPVTTPAQTTPGK